MKHLKHFEDYVPMEYVPFEEDHESYKNEDKKKKKKKKGIVDKVDVMPNKTKDEISFKSKY